MRTRATAGAVIVSVLGLIAGCGGGGASERGVTKAEFVKRANSICKERVDELARSYTDLAEEVERGEVKQTQAAAKFVNAIFLPGVRQEIAKLERLTPPEEHAEQIAAILAAGRTGVRRAEGTEPGVLFRQADYAFNDLNRLARAYGLRMCGST